MFFNNLSFIQLFFIHLIVFTYTTCQMDDPLNNSDAELSPNSFQRKVDDYFAAYHSFLDSGEKEQPKQTRESKISKTDEQKRKKAEYAKAFRIDARRRKILGLPSRGEERRKFKQDNPDFLRNKRKEQNKKSHLKYIQKIKQDPMKKAKWTAGRSDSSRRYRKRIEQRQKEEEEEEEGKNKPKSP